VDRSLLADLQTRRAYPSVTVLVNTGGGGRVPVGLDQLLDDVDRRLSGDVDDEQRQALGRQLAELADRAAVSPARAVALCASPGFSAVVPLATAVTERVVIDETFATRDLVVSLNRTARYQVATISERLVRLFDGDRHRLVERSDGWPLVRPAGQGATAWRRAVATALTAAADADRPLVALGVQRTLDRLLPRQEVPVLATIAGNHDRTGWAWLHHLVWPVVLDWLRADHERALQVLDHARSRHRFASGIEQVWTLAQEGAVELLVVEEGYELSARIHDGRICPAADREAPDVVDDVVDELIEEVMRRGGRAVLVPDGSLEPYNRVAAALRR
jgi:hypothetical protein